MIDLIHINQPKLPHSTIGFTQLELDTLMAHQTQPILDEFDTIAREAGYTSGADCIRECLLWNEPLKCGLAVIQLTVGCV